MNKVHHALLFFVASTKNYNLVPYYFDSEVVDQYYEKFGIDDARQLIKTSYNKPKEAEQMLLIVRADFITHEAQNALLKILEEPPISTRFIFVLVTGFSLLPTLLSRFAKEIDSKNIQFEINKEFKEFISQDYAERISLIEQAVKKKDIEWQRAIKQGLIEYLRVLKCDSNNLKKLEYAARVLFTRGASNKMLLENVALILDTRS